MTKSLSLPLAAAAGELAVAFVVVVVAAFVVAGEVVVAIHY